MPIRIVPDKKGGSQKKRQPRRTSTRRNTGGGSNLGGGLVNFLPMIFGMFKKNPKLIIIVVVIGAVIYFMGGCDGLLGGGGGGGNSLITNPDEYKDNNQNQSLLDQLFRGAELDEEKYDEAEVFEPLADNAKNPLPERVSLEKYCPKRLNQGGQGSCVGWASSYAARTILYARETGENPNNVRFSPSFLYNQIALPGCQGSYIIRAMENMQGGGALPFKEFAYNERECSSRPNGSQQRKAQNYKIKGFNRITQNGSNYKTNPLGVKQHLAQGSPVVIGMMVGGSFMQSMEGKDAWRPTKNDYNMRNFGGHAMCVIGYDDYKFGNEGGFQIMNSWGENWGKKGIFWVSYSDFDYFTREAYGLHPMGDANAVTTPIIAAEFGLVNNDSKRNISLRHVGGNTYSTSSPIAIGTKFKIEVTNQKECYTYVFGEETNGTSYVLFPYNEKHSPYCGITGTRVFPKDHSMMADDIGTQDQMAIVVTHEPLDYRILNQKITNSTASTFDGKIKDALGGEINSSARYSGSKNGLYVEADTRRGNAFFAVIQIKKE